MELKSRSSGAGGVDKSSSNALGKKFEPHFVSTNRTSLLRCHDAPSDARRTNDLEYTKGLRLKYQNKE